jgi:hypothetical protein
MVGQTPTAYLSYEPSALAAACSRLFCCMQARQCTQLRKVCFESCCSAYFLKTVVSSSDDPGRTEGPNDPIEALTTKSHNSKGCLDMSQIWWRIKGRHCLGKIRAINNLAVALFEFRGFFLCSQNHLNLVVINNVPLFFNIRDGPYMPTLRLLHQCKSACRHTTAPKPFSK